MDSIPGIIAQLKADTGSGGVNTLVGGRIYTLLSPEVFQVYPQIVVAPLSCQTDQQYSGPSGLETDRLAIACFSKGPSNPGVGVAAAVAKAVQKRLDGQSGTWGGIVVQGAFMENKDGDSIQVPDMGPDFELFSVQPEFEIWYVTPA